MGEGSAPLRAKPSGQKSWPWSARRELKGHPTAKPTAMLADALLDLSNRGDIVVDGIVRVNSILPARAPRRAGAPLFLITNYRRARPDSTPKIAYTYLP